MTDADRFDAATPRRVAADLRASPVRFSLRARVALFTALAIALVIGVTTYLQSRVFEQTVERELEDTARLTALAIADDLQLRPGGLAPESMRRTLDAFIETVPELRSISVITLGPAAPSVFASTSSAERTEALDVGRRAIAGARLVWGDRTGPLRTLAVPLTRDSRVFGAVTVTMSFAALLRFQDTGRKIAGWATVIAIAVLFLLVELLARRYIHRPIGAIRATMTAVVGGTLSARTPVMRSDEIGGVAAGLNHMLEEMQDLHAGLQHRVAQATGDLRARNRELLEMYQQMFELRDELGHAQQLAAVGEAASAVAHQIGTPLNLVSGHIQLLMEEQGPASPVTRRLQIAEEQLRKVASIVEGLLDRSRRRPRREPIDIGHTLGRLCSLVEPALETAGIRLVYEAQPVRSIEADAAQVELALLNLFSNAIDAMPDGGQLTIRVAEVAEAARIEVSDTGTGIPADVVDRIFEPWFTTKPAGLGTGLGLSIARRVIVEHGGRIGVQSAAGRGSVFVVELPLNGVNTAEVASHA